MTGIVDLRDVARRFGAVTAVADMTLSLREGEFFSLLGPSGCGKTTALRMIAGFLEPSAGTIRIDGRDMAGVPANRRPTNMVFQSYAIFPHLNVGDNIAYGLRGHAARDEIDRRVADALDMVELGGLQSRRATELSGGQRQRVALARALVMRPRVLLLDEPLSALDKRLREQMQFELRALQRTLGITFVMVTHDQYEAMTMSDRIGVMFDGRLVQVEVPERLYALPRDRRVAEFIGGMNLLPATVRERSGERLTVEVPGFGPLAIPANPNAARGGASILVGIRPEQIEIGAGEPQGCDATAQGTVETVAFYGETVHYRVRVPGIGVPLTISVPNRFHAVEHGGGEPVWIGIRSASVIDLGEEDEQGETG